MWWVSALLVVVEILGVVSAMHALLNVRTSQGSIAWVVSLLTFPAVVVPTYWVLGRNKFNGYVIAREHADEDLHDEAQRVVPAITPFLLGEANRGGKIRVAEGLAKFPFLNGNAVELLIDGKDTFDSILAGMDEAREYLLVQFFIVKDDSIGRRLQAKMIEKAQQGVSVRFLYDEIGSHRLPKSYVQKLREGGVQAQPFHSRQGHSNRFQINFRNHRKVVVADGRSGWVGGHNVGDEYVDGHPELGHWRDTHLKIQGPAVLGLQLAFCEDWNWATGKEAQVKWVPVPAPDQDLPVLILPSGPADKLETASLMIQQAIHAAQDRVWIASPYFVPDEGVTAALYLAVLRGVDVRILIPDEPDHKLVYHAAFAFLGEIIDAGISVYRYHQGFLHQKVFLVDDVAAGVGTVNLDNRSFRLNFEITALVASETFAGEVSRMLEADFAKSRLMTSQEISSMSTMNRVISRASYLFAPIL